MIENVQIDREIARIRNDDANWVFALASLGAGPPECFVWQPHRHPVDLQCVFSNHQGITERTDLKQTVLVEAGGETRGSLFGRRYFAIDRHGEVQNDSRPLH
jgi:hypothetical protein